MRKGSKKIYIWMMIAAIIIFLFLSGWLFLERLEEKREQKFRKMTSMAEEYVRDKFEQEMVFVEVSRPTSMEELAIKIIFSPKTNPDFKFAIYMFEDQETGEIEVSEDGYSDELICCRIIERYQVIANEIWDNNGIRIDFNINDRIGMNLIFHAPSSVGEFAELDDIAGDIMDDKFIISLDICYSSEAAEKEIEAEKIYQFVKQIQKEDFLPERLVIYRVIEKDHSSEKIYRLKNIGDINSVEQIYEMVHPEIK